ncbi:hypothetical protein PR202_gb05380 [Eleusine coracana subsp. coracana]|uniref:Uncharacterized protein n=1 Tax=Eleusine coracana subsp. coracana TaxID=191504 RepID=A0AAV5E6V2_ELECO|nr:hypothetical protein QOZ80_1BG0076730 [Eleusine coracana subsp. coracana]GJN18240.1 hypothetical protein PR202_gb05380 [Eleusine coracana subsp. coracana]
MEAEAFPIRFTKGIRSYWRRRNYKTADVSGGTTTTGRGTKRHQLVRLGGGEGGGGGDGPKKWAVRLGGMARRVKAPAPAVAAAKAPARVLGKIRDAYVDVMLGAAKTQPVAAKAQPTAAQALWQKRVPVRRTQSQARQQADELGQRLVEEMYKSVLASRSVSGMLRASERR